MRFTQKHGAGRRHGGELAALLATAGLFLAWQRCLAIAASSPVDPAASQRPAHLHQPQARRAAAHTTQQFLDSNSISNNAHQPNSNSAPIISQAAGQQQQPARHSSASATAAAATAPIQTRNSNSTSPSARQAALEAAAAAAAEATKQEILCEQRLNDILMIQKRLNSSDGSRLIATDSKQQQQQLAATLATATGEAAAAAAAAAERRSTNAGNNSTCPKETAALAQALDTLKQLAGVATATATATAAANERTTPEFNANRSADSLPASSQHESGTIGGGGGARHSGQTKLHFGAKVALSILFATILLVASATMFDLSREARKRARNLRRSHRLAERGGDAAAAASNLSHVISGHARSGNKTTAINLYDQLRFNNNNNNNSCTSTRTSSISCSVTSASAPILVGGGGGELRYCGERGAWFKLTHFEDSQQPTGGGGGGQSSASRGSFNCESEAECLTKPSSSSNSNNDQLDSDEATTESMLIQMDGPADDGWRSRQESFAILGPASKQQQQQQQQKCCREGAGTAPWSSRWLIEQIFLSFSLCHSCSLIFQDDNKKAPADEQHASPTCERKQRAAAAAAAATLCRYHLTGGHRSRLSSLSSISEQEALADAAKRVTDITTTTNQRREDATNKTASKNHQQQQQQQQQQLSIDSLHGLRFLSMIWIIVIHTYSFAFQWSFFKYTSENIYKTAASQLIANGAFACDSFFLIAGFLLPYLTFPAYEGGREHTTAASSNRRLTTGSERRHSLVMCEHGGGGDGGGSSTCCNDLLSSLSSPAASPSPSSTSSEFKQSKQQLKLAQHHPHRHHHPQSQQQQQQQQQLDSARSACSSPDSGSSSSGSSATLEPTGKQRQRTHLRDDNCLSSSCSSCSLDFSSRQSAGLAAGCAAPQHAAAAMAPISSHHQHQYHYRSQQQQQQPARMAPHWFPMNCFQQHHHHQAVVNSSAAAAAAVAAGTETGGASLNRISNSSNNNNNKQRHSIKFTFTRLLANLLHRYMRMMPLMMAIIGLSATLLRYLGEGPAWDYSTLMYDKWCRKNWWINALFLHNFLNRENMCLSHSWYAAVDIQLFLLGQVILFVLARSKRFGILICCLCLFGGQIITGALTLIHHLPALPLHASVSQQSMSLYYGEIYIKPYCRASPYLIGILLAYLMRTTSLGQVKLKRWQTLLGWMSSIGSLILILLSTLPAMNGQPPGELESALYNALSRPLWACATGWMVFACITKHGGIFEKILSARQFVPFSRLSYPAFLIHPIVMAISYGGRQASVPFSHYLMLCLVLGNIVITYASAFVLSALFELPLLSVERAIKRTWRLRAGKGIENLRPGPPASDR